MLGHILHHSCKFFPLTTTSNDALAAGTDLPASGSYVDVADFVWVEIIVWFDDIHGSDAPAMTPKCSDAANGTLDVISATLAHTAAADDDNEFVVWHIEVASLPTDHHFLALDVTAGVTNGTNAGAFMLAYSGTQPVTQTTAVLPSTSVYQFAGGQAVAM
jgi:hypothetical protein